MRVFPFINVLLSVSFSRVDRFDVKVLTSSVFEGVKRFQVSRYFERKSGFYAYARQIL